MSVGSISKASCWVGNSRYSVRTEFAPRLILEEQTYTSSFQTKMGTVACASWQCELTDQELYIH